MKKRHFKSVTCNFAKPVTKKSLFLAFKCMKSYRLQVTGYYYIYIGSIFKLYMRLYSIVIFDVTPVTCNFLT